MFPANTRIETIEPKIIFKLITLSISMKIKELDFKIKEIAFKLKRLTLEDVIFIILPFIVLMYLIVPHFFPNSLTNLIYDPNQHFSYSGSSDAFDFNGGITDIALKARIISLGIYGTNWVEFYSVKNITLENRSGGLEKLNNGNVKIESCPVNQAPITISGVENDFFLTFGHVDLKYDATVFNYNYSDLTIDGSMQAIDHFQPGSGKVNVRTSACNVHINGIIPNPSDEISFEMDNTSYINSNLSEAYVYARGLYDVVIDSHSGSKVQYYLIEHPFELQIEQSNGKLRLANHLFDINSADVIDIKASPYSPSLFRFQDKTLTFNGNTNSVKLSDEDIIINDFSYWLEYQPDKITGFGVYVSAYLSLLAIYLPYRREKIKMN